MVTEPNTLASKVAQALSNVLSEHEQGFVTKWITLIETAEAEGRRGMWTLACDDMTAWDADGMLTYALHIEQAKVVADEANRSD